MLELVFINPLLRDSNIIFFYINIINNYKYNYIFFLVMIPVSSTVIPLPVYKVGYGLGFISKDKKTQLSFKPEDNIKLITSKY